AAPMFAPRMATLSLPRPATSAATFIDGARLTMLADAPDWLLAWAVTRSRTSSAPDAVRLDLGERPAWLACSEADDLSERALEQLDDMEWTPRTEAQLRSALAIIPAIERDVWLRAGMALHTSGWPNAFEIWDAWSRTCPEKYNEADQHRTWNGFRGSRN